MNRQEKFYKIMSEELKDMGAKDNDVYLERMYPLALETKHGTLIIDVIKEAHSKTAKLYNCFTRFVDIDKARDNIDCNPYSGKWNFHITVKDISPQDAANAMLFRIKQQLPKLPTE